MAAQNQHSTASPTDRRLRCKAAFDPTCGLSAYFLRLNVVFGWRYICAVVLTYGVNQGMGEALVFTARKYFIFDGMQLDASTAARLVGFSRIPWQLKSLFGVLSDALPIGGRHRGPYMLLAGLLGIVGSCSMAATPESKFSLFTAGLMLLFCNVNFAMPDVMIDATVAERAKVAPERAADLQALCWGSLGAFGIPIALVSGNLLESGGARLLFALAIFTSSATALPPLLGWLGEKPKPSGCAASRQLCRDLASTLPKRSVLMAATLVGCYSVSLGLFQLFVADTYPDEVAFATMVGNFVLCVALYLIMRRVDVVLARAVIFPFLQGALTPRSDIIFDWSHSPSRTSSDQRCWSAAQCAANVAAAANATFSNASTMMDDGSELPCGWARLRGNPCLSPVVMAYIGVAGNVALVLGTAAYTSCFQTWRFRSIIALTQLLAVFASLTDWMWALRINLRLGLPDVMFAFGEEVFIDAVDALSNQPFFIFAAKLCPNGVEASMFALFMGLSNFGSDAGQYLGASLLKSFGNPVEPEFEGMVPYLMCKSLMRALPILLIPFLVPGGTPADSAAAMGAVNIVAVVGGGDDAPAGGPGAKQDAGLLRGAEVRSDSSMPAEIASANAPDAYDGVAGEVELGTTKPGRSWGDLAN